MLGLIRRSLWWLVVLALPLQAMAGTIGLHCAGMHGRMAGVPAASASHRHDGGEQAGAHHHGHAAQGAAADDDHAGLADGQSGQNDPTARGSCSACAACCAALGLPASLQLWPASDFGQPLPAVVPAGRLSFVTSGPDRPPRTSTL